MKILFIGNRSENINSKIRSLRKMNHGVDLLETSNIFPYFKYSNYLFYRFNFSIFDLLIENFYKKKVKSKYDLIFFFNSPYINQKSINYLKAFTKKIIFYCSDNPFLKRDKNLWKSFLSSKNLYDLIIFQQPKRDKYAKKHKIKKYIIVPPSVDFSFFKKNIYKESKKFDVTFVGTWFPERGKFFYELHKKGLAFKIFGPRWDKDKKYYKKIKKKIVLGPVNFKKYKKIISQSKMNVCLFSKENDDDITERCTEITALGGMLICQFSKTISKIYKKNKEVLFFKNYKEFFNLYKKYSMNNNVLKKISYSGYKKTRLLNLDEKKILKKILDLTFNIKSFNKKFIYKF